MENNELEGKVNDLRELASFASSKGGTMLKKAYVGDILNSIRGMKIRYQSMSHTEFIALAASISEKLEVVELLNGAPGDFESAVADLKTALEEHIP